jgi:hypothetical protein
MNNIISSEEENNKYTFQELYVIFDNILSGCKTMVDAVFFAQKILQNNMEYKELLIGMIHGKSYDKVLDYRTIAHTLCELNDVEYRDDIDDFIDKNLKNNVDTTQLNSIMRISRIKNIRIGTENKNKLNIFNTKDNHKIEVKFTNKLFNFKKENTINKICPHCNINIPVPKDSTYIICGYMDDTYLWLGCGRDWCGNCNKMLCKSWDDNNLQDSDNRIHNKECCKKYAEENKIDINLFCDCVN